MRRKNLYKCLALSLAVSMAVPSVVYASPANGEEGQSAAAVIQETETEIPAEPAAETEEEAEAESVLQAEPVAETGKESGETESVAAETQKDSAGPQSGTEEQPGEPEQEDTAQDIVLSGASPFGGLSDVQTEPVPEEEI